MTSSAVDVIAGALSSLAIKAPCRACSTTNIAIMNGLLVVDGYQTVAGDRVLINGQTNPVYNGIYIADTGNWALAPDSDGASDLTLGSLIYVTNGTANSGYWYCTTTGTITPGTTAINFGLAPNLGAGISAFMQTVCAAANATAALALLTTGALTLTGEIAPAALSANTDNWAPAGFASASTILMGATAAWNLTGIAGGAKGRMICLHNTSAFSVTLKNSVTSTAANQFLLSADYVLAANQSVVLEYDDAASRWRIFGQQTVAAAATTVVRGALGGLTLSTAGSSATFSVSAGQAADSTNAAYLTIAAFSKTTGAWVVGTGNGGLDTGAISNNTWYHVFIIDTPAGGAADITISLSATTPTLSGAYVGGKYRRIGSLKTNGSAQWVAFVQDGDYFRLSASVLDIDATNPGTSAVTATLASVPTGVNVFALMNAGTLDGTSNTSWIMSDLAASDETPSSTAAPLLQMYLPGASATASYGFIQIRTNTSAQVRYRMLISGAADHFKIATLGWIDSRGRNA